jgi:hypothetical protein
MNTGAVLGSVPVGARGPFRPATRGLPPSSSRGLYLAKIAPKKRHRASLSTDPYVLSSKSADWAEQQVLRASVRDTEANWSELAAVDPADAR